MQQESILPPTPFHVASTLLLSILKKARIQELTMNSMMLAQLMQDLQVGDTMLRCRRM
jgi:hypothetical protein